MILTLELALVISRVCVLTGENTSYCKHIMYVTNKNDSFQEITKCYREAPYYTIDKYAYLVIKKKGELIHEEGQVDLTSRLEVCAIRRKWQFMIEIKWVQQQDNSIDYCRLPIVFPTSLAFGHDPKIFIYDHKKLRNHLVECIETGKV